MKHIRLSILLALLMISLPLATAQQNGPHSPPGEDIQYAEQSVEIDRDDEDGVVIMRFGHAEMGIDYGDGEIEMWSEQTRFLGVVDVYDEDRAYHGRHGIPVTSVFWQQIVGTLEYVDENENGILDVDAQRGVGTFDELEDGLEGHEEVIKYVAYDDVDWQMVSWQESQDGNEVELRFTLLAQNLTYGDDEDYQDGMDVVDFIAYHFRVSTAERTVEVEALPHYNVGFSGDIDSPLIEDSEEIARSNVTGHVLDSDWKYDQDIRGWDLALDEDGYARNDTRLFTLLEIGMGTKVHPAVGMWMREEFGHLVRPGVFIGSPLVTEMGAAVQEDHDLHGNPLDCGLAYVEKEDDVETEGRQHESDEERREEERREKVRAKIRTYEATACAQRGEEIAAGGIAAPQVVRAGAIRFDDDGVSAGLLRWVSNATADGVETEVLFQVHGARPALPSDMGRDDGLGIGIRMVGGYNYVAAADVYHDPEFSADILTVETQGFVEPVTGIGAPGLFRILLGSGLLVMAVFALAVGVAVGAVVKRRRDVAPMPATKWEAVPLVDEDWDRYRV